MEHQVCLDTDAVIAILKGEPRAERLIDRIQDDIICVSAVTLFELLLRETRLEHVEAFRRTARILDFDEEAARTASTLLKALRRKGRPIEFRDLFIAATCLVHRCPLATFNRRHYRHVTDLKLVPAL